MESFDLLRYWRGRTAGSSSATNLLDPTVDGEETDDEGPFFDLEFVDNEDRSTEDRGGDHEDVVEDEKDFDFSLNSSDGSDALPISTSSDDIFFKGKLVPLESNSIVIAAGDSDQKTQLSVSLLKSATKFRVFILGLRKSNKSATVESNVACVSPKQSHFFVKFRVDEVPIVSLFTRDGSSRNQEKISEIDAGEEKTKSSNSKEVMQKYLSKIKPLYVRVSKKYADKLRFSGPLVQGGLPATEIISEEEKEAEAEEPEESKMAEKNTKLAMPGKLRLVYEKLGKSRSAMAAVSSPEPKRRDDSLLQQQDGIQSAIAHCKRSFTATSKETESPLQPSKSNPEAERV